MNRRSFLAGLLGVSALAPVVASASAPVAAPAIAETFEPFGWALPDADPLADLRAAMARMESIGEARINFLLPSSFVDRLKEFGHEMGPDLLGGLDYTIMPEWEPDEVEWFTGGRSFGKTRAFLKRVGLGA